MFLPLADRGIDALVHRLSDGTYHRVQAKGRSSLVDGEVHLVVWSAGLLDDDALLVSGLVVDGGLGPMMLVVPVGGFKSLADQTSADGEVVYSMGFGMQPRSDSRWLPFLVRSGELIERFGPAPGIDSVEAEVIERTAPPTWRSDLGFLGESEVVRLLAEGDNLNLFRPFPDLETSELAVLQLSSRRVVGLQIKTVGIDRDSPATEIHVLASSFRPSPSTYFAVLGWQRDQSQFHDECLLIPSERVRALCQPAEAHGHLKFYWHPGSPGERLDPFRRPLSELRSAIVNLVE